MNIKILGPGCSNCKKLEANVKEALKESGMDATIEKIEDIEKIMSYGVMNTPALVVDEKVVFSGRVLSPKDIGKYLKQ